MKDLIYKHYDLFSFITKCVVLTCCVGYIISCYAPKYYFPEPNKRCNIITGTCERYSNCSYNKGWSE